MAELFCNNPQLEDLDGEIWIDALGFDGIYEVSNLGRIKSLGRWVANGGSGRWVKEKIRRQAKSKDGRLTCPFSIGGIYYSQNPSALVYFSFNPDKYYSSDKNCITHKNKIPYDNRLENLMLDNFSNSHHINWEKGLLTHLKENNQKRTIEYNKLTERECKVCKETKPIKKFKHGCRKCLKCEYLHRRGSKVKYHQLTNIQIKCLENNEIFSFKNTIDLGTSGIISRPRFRGLMKDGKKTFRSTKTKLEYLILSVA